MTAPLHTRLVVLLALLPMLQLGPASAAAEQESYFSIPLSSLKLAEGQTLAGGQRPAQRWQLPLPPWVIIDQPRSAEALLAGPEDRPFEQPAPMPVARLLVRAPAGTSRMLGRLVVPDEDGSRMRMIGFTIDDLTGLHTDRAAFVRAQLEHYRQLQQRNVAGSAWFRHQARDLARELGQISPAGDGQQPLIARQRFFAQGEIDRTIGLYTGGRAVAENLQLERALPSSTQPAELDVAIDTLGGITIQEMDWAATMKDQPAPELDPLASLIPADQHAIFFPSFPDMRRFLDEAQKQGSIFVVSADALRSESFETLKRYQRQLCLPLEELSGVLSPPLVRSVAITGSDAYLRVGSDVAVLFQTADAQAMFAITTARRSAQLDAGLARQVAGEIDGVSYQGAVTPDRSICSYSAALDNSFVVTNSLSQLRRIIRTHQGQSPALAGLPEYRFFRHRYARGQDAETAFLILSDATIRRWCGPTWRILDSRRTLAAALMSELLCQHIDALVSGGAIDEKLLEPEFSLPNLGQVMLSSSGIRCNYGSLQFMTPIVELAEGLTHVSTFEAEAYKRWRNTYQQNWSRYFDPIACRFSIVDAAEGATSLAADLTVMPLIVGTEYRQFIAITAGASLKPGSGDPHPQAIGHLALAIDPDAGTVRSYNNLLENLAGDLRLEPLSWLGSCVALYADDDPFWTELAAAEDPEEFLEHNLSRLPIALYAESRDPLRLAAFLTAFRGFVEQTAPNLTRWETLRHADVSYVKVQAEAVVNGNPIAVYYVALPAALIVSPSEPVIRRAIERNAGPATRPATQSAYAWLGSNVGVRIDPRLLEVLDRISGDDAVRQLQRQAWSNLPILNEWKRRFPDRDPIGVHRRLFAATLIDPAGGSYSWNDRWQTMQSLNYGHPGEPEPGPGIADLLRHYSGEFGLTFEHNGLRARAKVRQHNPG